MKKFLKVILSLVITLIIVICLANELGIFSVSEISLEQLDIYSNYYFDKLDLNQKEIYIKLDKAVQKQTKNVPLGIQKNENFEQDIALVIEAYFYDNPECYYLSNKYSIVIRDLKLFKTAILELNYIVNELEHKDEELKQVVTDILQNTVEDSMTDYEKELAIHDALVKHTKYYQYEDINNIPAIKHTAYGALVEKEAVCDGYSKAFKLLLKEAGIESIIISGTMEDTSHAWNMVKIEDEYYHVDVTSDSIKERSKEFVVHRYFNITDEQIEKTHTVGKKFNHPTTQSDKYDYYNYNGLYIKEDDNLYSTLRQIISKDNNAEVLEIKVNGGVRAQAIIDTLYDLDFNNWRSNAKSRVSYIESEGVYIFVK